MPSVLSHPALPMALAVGLGRRFISRRLAFAAAIASILPDLDVLSFRFGIPYLHDFGHRGASHSLTFALLIGVIGALAAGKLRAKRRMAFWLLFISCASHPLLDMLTDGGHGVALFWPFSSQRYFFPLRIIDVSPLAIDRFLGPAGLQVVASELLWIWLPCALLAGTLAFWQREA